MTGDWLPPQTPGGEPTPQPPPEAPQQQPHPPPPGYWQPRPVPPPQQPPNNQAVAGFTCGIIGVSLLFFTAGLSSIVSLALGIVAIPYSRKGKRNVAEGRTTKHKDLANAGFVIALITVVLSVLATITWILIFALVDWDEIDDSNDDPFDDSFEIRAAVRIVATAVRLLA
ncbi:MAG: hypothetical protein ACRDJY_04320 [Thermoleophilaceae bacterium]